jgi:threonylcarbamoyladenosine tRNA methylthiotransferase MtaB
LSFKTVDLKPAPFSATVITLGCKVNQFESAAISRKLEKAGYRLVGQNQPAAVTVINTCTVTHRADFEVRALVRRAHRRNPLGRIVLTGCFAQINPDEASRLPGVTHVLGQDQKASLVQRLTENPTSHQPLIDVLPSGRLRISASLGYPEFDRTRAFFRIQDGCSAGCTYCTVPKARGPSRSLPAEQVFEGLRFYADSGYREVVLTGIHLGAWGLDLEPAGDFSSLLAGLSLVETPRLRLSSIEPNEVTKTVVSLIREDFRFCPHLHLPLQSGSDSILNAMKRPYGSALFRELVETVVSGRDDICLGVDVLVGFPGEDESAFEATRNLIASLPISYVHVFPFSPRPGTPAAFFSDRPDSRVIKQRVNVLRSLGQIKRLDFYRRSIGRIRPTLVENEKDRQTGWYRGLTDNYIPVLLPESGLPSGEIEPVKILEISSDGRVLGQVARNI